MQPTPKPNPPNPSPRIAPPADDARKELWELWEQIHEDGCSQLSYFPSSQAQSRKSLPADANLLTKIEAFGYDDAMQKRNDFLGWGKYKPMT